MSENQFHKAFKLQGKAFSSVEELVLFSKSISIEVFTFLNSWFNNKSFIEVKTSGSTGKPKTIQLQKTHMVNSAKATGEFFNLFENTVALLCMSPNFIAGKMMLVRALTLGWELDIVEVVSNPLNRIQKDYDFCAMVPLQLNNSLAEIGSIKKLIVGGGVVSKELLRDIQNVSTVIFATYGMTETVTHIAIKKLNHVITSETKQSKSKATNNCHSEFVEESQSKATNDCHSEFVEESHYKTLPNVLISKDNRDCLVIDAPNISSSIIITNDIVNLISSTEFEWLGRFDSIINSGGIKLIPEQIELKLSRVIKQRFFVTGISDTILGEKLVLIVEGEKNNVILDEVQQLTSLSKFEKPKKIYFVSKFKETETKKINRHKTVGLLDVNKL